LIQYRSPNTTRGIATVSLSLVAKKRYGLKIFLSEFGKACFHHHVKPLISVLKTWISPQLPSLLLYQDNNIVEYNWQTSTKMMICHILSKSKPTKASVVLFHPTSSNFRFSLNTFRDYDIPSSRRCWSDNTIHTFRYIDDRNYYHSVQGKIEPFKPPERRNTSTLSNTATQNGKESKHQSLTQKRKTKTFRKTISSSVLAE
jgi:hypothetical protein